MALNNTFGAEEDIVERLRNARSREDSFVCNEAANEIESLRAQLAEVTRERNDYKQAVDDLGLTPEEARAGARRSRDMKQQLLATQAHAARLVEALEKLLRASAFCEIARVTQFDQKQAAAKESVYAIHDAQAALSTPINLDALHEDRARTLEEAAQTFDDCQSGEHLLDLAAAHRAKKSG